MTKSQQTGSTLTRNDISEKISKELNMPKLHAGNILDTTLDMMIESLVADGELKLSAFGSFNVRQKNDRVGRNPKTGVEVTITPRKTISFKASEHLKSKVSEVGVTPAFEYKKAS